MTHDEAVARGIRAEQILTDDVFREAMKLLRDGCAARWAASVDAAGREAEWRLIKSAEELERFLTLLMQRGKEADRKIERERVKQRVKRRLVGGL